MKITNQLIRSKSDQSSLQSIKHLNLSNLKICILEKLNSCTKLQSLDVSSNLIESVPTTIEQCPQLWSLNISNNKVRCLDGFGRFVAIGSLDLSNNQLTWHEISKLQHLHILDLRLHGNAHLEKDPYYRIHIIDCLPHVWMIDGRLVTTAERIQVNSFFDDSAVSDRPVRHKLSTSRSFIPSAQKNREVNGIFGEKVIHLMRRFPKQDVINIDLDVRRLRYLSENIAQNIILHSTNAHCRKEPNAVISDNFLIELLEARRVDALRCNMFIMLLLTSMEFKIPDSLFKETLELMKLDRFGNLSSMEVFTLSRECRALVAGVLLSAVKIERVDKQTGGLYDKLYLSLNYLLTESIKSCSGNSSPVTDLYRQYRSLLAAEVVLLMCYVPSFSDYMQKEPGVMSLVTCATCDTQSINNVLTLKNSLQMQKVDEVEQIKALGQFIQSAVMFHLSKSPGNSTGSENQAAEHKIFSKRPLPKRPMSGPVFSSSYHTRGKTSPNIKPPRVISAKPKRTKLPDVGETVLTSPQCLARIVSLPQPDIALVLLEMIPVNGGMQSKTRSFEEHYAYIDTKELVWDSAKYYWKPRGTSGNRVTLHYVQELHSTTALDSESDEVSICHHSAGGVTSITVPTPYGDGKEKASLIVDIKTHQDLLTVSPRKPGSVPTPSPAHSPAHSPTHSPTRSPTRSPPPARRYSPVKTDMSSESVELDKLSLADPMDSAINSNNNACTEVDITSTTEDRLMASPPHAPPEHTDEESTAYKLSNAMLPMHQEANEVSSARKLSNEASPAVKSANQMSVVQIGAPPMPHQRLLLNTPDYSVKTRNSTPKASQDETEQTGKEIEDAMEMSAEYIDIDAESGSDDEELSDFAREDLIKDTLSNNALERSISDRNIAPSNSPDMRIIHSNRSSNLTSRQPSASIHSVYKMLRTEQTHKTSLTLNRPQMSSYEDDLYSLYPRESLPDWDMRIQDPDATPNVTVKWANQWLGGGRDLHLEEMKSRPSSAHVPGWRDGLKGTARTRSAHTMRYVSGSRKYPPTVNKSGSRSKSSSSYDRQLEFQRYNFRPQQSTYRSTYLSSKDNMRDKKQLVEMQRDVAWSEYVKGAMLHRALQ